MRFLIDRTSRSDEAPPRKLEVAPKGSRPGCERGLDTRKETGVDVLRILIAIVLPPLGVFLQVGIGKQFWINVLLTILGYLPGIIHAIWVITSR